MLVKTAAIRKVANTARKINPYRVLSYFTMENEPAPKRIPIPVRQLGIKKIVIVKEGLPMFSFIIFLSILAGIAAGAKLAPKELGFKL